MRDVVIVDNVRTGLAKSFRGSFNLTRSDDMVAHVVDALLERNPKVSPDEVEDLVLGGNRLTVADHLHTDLHSDPRQGDGLLRRLDPH